jgi:hypothetical protein
VFWVENLPGAVLSSCKYFSGILTETSLDAVVPFASRNGTSLSVTHENLARYEMDSKVGYGIVEYLIGTL